MENHVKELFEAIQNGSREGITCFQITNKDTGKGESLEKSIVIVSDMAKGAYTDAFAKGRDISESAIFPMCFMLGTDKTTMVIPNIESIISMSKQKAMVVIRKIRNDLIRRGHTMKFYIHASEIRMYDIPRDSPAYEYAQRTGKVFPGTPIFDRFMINTETPEKVASIIYDIKDGKFTLNKELTRKVDEAEITDVDESGKYQGLFTHVVYKPDEEIELEGERDMKLDAVEVTKEIADEILKKKKQNPEGPAS